MRINNRDLAGMGAAGTGRTGEAERAGREAGAGAYGSSHGDRVEFSAGLEQVARAVSSYSAARGERTQALVALYQSGGYRPDSSAISKAMVSDALGAGETE